MKIKALHSIRYDGKRLKAGQVGDLPDLEAGRLIAQGWAVEAPASASKDTPTPVRRNVDKMVESVVTEGAKRGRSR